MTNLMMCFITHSFSRQINFAQCHSCWDKVNIKLEQENSENLLPACVRNLLIAAWVRLGQCQKQGSTDAKLQIFWMINGRHAEICSHGSEGRVEPGESSDLASGWSFMHPIQLLAKLLVQQRNTRWCSSPVLPSGALFSSLPLSDFQFALALFWEVLMRSDCNVRLPDFQPQSFRVGAVAQPHWSAGEATRDNGGASPGVRNEVNSEDGGVARPHAVLPGTPRVVGWWTSAWELTGALVFLVSQAAEWAVWSRATRRRSNSGASDVAPAASRQASLHPDLLLHGDRWLSGLWFGLTPEPVVWWTEWSAL